MSKEQDADDRMTAFGYRFPIMCCRTCTNCGTQWHDWLTEATAVCLNCGSFRKNKLEYIWVENSARCTGVDLYSLICHLDTERTNLISKLDPQLPEDHPFWSQTLAWLFETLAGPEREHLTQTEEAVALGPEASELDVNEIQVWFDAVCRYTNDGRTIIAGVVEVDGNRVVTWRRQVAEGAGTTQEIGDYCALISALYWVSNTLTVLEGIAGPDGVPHITIGGDSGVIDYQLHSVPVSNTWLIPLRDFVRGFLDEPNMSLTSVKRAENPAKSLLA